MKNKAVYVDTIPKGVLVKIKPAKGNALRKRLFPSMGQALAYVQTKENDSIPAFINGNPTIIKAWGLN